MSTSTPSLLNDLSLFLNFIDAETTKTKKLKSNSFEKLVFKKIALTTVPLRYKALEKNMTSPHFVGQYISKKGATRIAFFKETPVSKLTRYYMRKGLYIKSYAACLNAFKRIYTILKTSRSPATIEKLGGYSPVVGFVQHIEKFLNPQILTGWFAKSFRQAYTIKCITPTKLQKKHVKKKFIVQHSIVHPYGRVNLALKNAHFFTEEQPRRVFEERIFLALCDGLFKYRNGVLAKRRLKMYNKVLRGMK